MFRKILMLFGIFMLVVGPVVAAESVEKAPPPTPYKKVSELVKLPDFLPGIGTLYVDPKTLPAGPFLAYDRAGKLVSTIYMIPLKDIDEHKTMQDSKRPGATSTILLCITTLGIQACRNLTITSCCGM